MTLSISTTNVLVGQTPSITDTGVGEVALNISDPDHSLNYTCGSSSAHFTVDYSAQANISYVGVSGHNAATTGPATIQLFNGGVLIDSVVIKRNHNVMFTFPTMTFSNLIVKFITSPVTYQMTVSFIAAGQHLPIETGEQAGYKRLWLNRQSVQRTTTNLQVGPVSSLTQKKAVTGALVLPNATADFAENEWQDFIDFSFEQPFFIKEQDDDPKSSYMCFNPMPEASAHSQTRKLVALKLKFTAYTGL